MASESGTPPVVPDGRPSGPAPSEGAAPVRRSFFRRRVLPCLLLFVLLTLLAGAGAVWWLRTPGGQDWLRQEADALLAPPLAEQGLSLELIRLEGALPLEMECALRLRDAGGLWLDVPRARVDVGLSVFPPGISLDLRLEHPSLYRLPQLPPSPDEPSPPLAETLAGVETALRSALDITASLPGWLPSLRVREVALDGLWLGSAVLDGSSSGTLVDASGQAAQDAAASAGAGSVPADGQTPPAPAVAAFAPAQEAMTPGAPPAPPLSVAVSVALPSLSPSSPVFPFSAPEVFCTSELSVSSPENPETSESLAAKSENALSSLYCSASVHTILPAENRKTAAQTPMAICIPIFFFIPVPSLLMLNFKGFPVICQ